MKYLLVDLGSTYTKLHIVDTEKNAVTAAASAYTTVETDVAVGFNVAFQKLKDAGAADYDRILGCSSASGGLKIVVIGFSKSLTTEAARLASLSAGGRILKIYSYELSDEDVAEIEKSGADIIVLSGGTENGNKQNIIVNAEKLSAANLQNATLLVAGNTAANPKIKAIFEQSPIVPVFTENVMPATNVVNYKPLRETIGNIFINTIAFAKGIHELSKNFEILLPTPVAVQKAVAAVKKVKGAEVMAVDIGGATTDVHSVAKSFHGEENILSPLFEDPYEKRTVEGDMGMRYSACALYESVGEEAFRKFGIENAKEKTDFRFRNTAYIPETFDEYEFDQIMAHIAAKEALKRHVGTVKKVPTSTRTMFQQNGKDLRFVKYFIGTGGVLIHSKAPERILCAIHQMEENYLAPKNCTFLLDKSYLLASAGLIATVDEQAACKLLEKYLEKV
ncbi:glutamate mutase [Treponema phagedenis]|uniref:Protein MutL n=1 Tax=Treponema phagedenis TaxID=162 RepID=A0A0B7GRS1_TREPH|nr:glutamate mutase L [Treponema phagedenis]EFW37447.1 hypothetical protein HMPREF9554_02022 [Treponema phagedenis F0421]NVP24791.1 glutamate mutase L [Treponema phagedenis]QEK00402.1 glutamate mutase [Treponema phagedenis]QEK05412.1 glutamate mutase [Treponema phagedenis]QKS93099.1 glutamate mutase L [Treponema phagedenis]